MRRQRESATVSRKKSRKRILIGIVAVSAMVAVTMSLSFADVDLHGKIKSWANQEADKAISGLQSAIRSETENQKVRLQQELRSKLDEQATELGRFTEEQKQQRVKDIQAYADQLLASRDFSSTADKAQIQAKLNQILDSAKQAMLSLDASYVPPQTRFEPGTEPVSNGKPTVKVPEEPKEDMSVSGSVYGDKAVEPNQEG